MNQLPLPSSGSPLRKVLITIAGTLVIIAGILMLVFPGPGLLAIAGGLAILSTEYHWARRLLERVRAKIESIKSKAEKPKDDKPKL